MTEFRRFRSESGFTAHDANPYVGYVNSGNSIEFIREGNAWVCRMSRGGSLTMVLILVVILASFWGMSQSREFADFLAFLHEPLGRHTGFGLIVLFVILLFGYASVFAAMKLLRANRFRIEGSGNLQLYSGPGQEPHKTIRSGEIKDLKIEEVTFQGEHRTYVNYLLVMFLNRAEADSRPMVLCVSTDEALIRQIRQEIVDRAGLRVEEMSSRA